MRSDVNVKDLFSISGCPGSKMILITVIFLTFVFGVESTAEQNTTALCDSDVDDYLSTYNGTHRLLIVTASSPQDGKYARQRYYYFTDTCELATRQIVIMSLFKDDPHNSHARDYNHDAGAIAYIEPCMVYKITKHYRLHKHKYSLVIVDKNGKVLKRYTRVATSAEIYQVIDTTPGRQNELKQNPDKYWTCY